MPNYCYYEMQIAGKKEDCDKWLARMRSYDEPNHFFRIFSNEVFDEFDAKGLHYMSISGDCAWSLDSCCRAGAYSDIDLFAANTEELHLKMEAFSSEPGVCFQEHYLYKYGECIVDECVDYMEFWWDRDKFPDFNEYKKEYDLPDSVTESDYDEEGCRREGGFPVWKFSI